MRIVISGSHGLVGRHLAAALRADRHEVIPLLRRGATPEPKSIVWDPATGVVEGSSLDGVDAVVHLAGESIAEGRWTAAKKARIESSRVPPTRNLSQILSRLAHPPQSFLCASAIGFYGDRGAEALTEASPAGRGFLPDVCRGWEAATDSAAQRGIRVANLRFGVILSPEGGALGKMLLPFKMGVGGKLGSGRQYMSWITLGDTVGAILYVLTHPELRGPVNVVAPAPATNSEFTAALGAALHRPAILPMPAVMARLAFGEMADALLLSSTRVTPEKLRTSGFAFNHPEIRGALARLLR